MQSLYTHSFLFFLKIVIRIFNFSDSLFSLEVFYYFFSYTLNDVNIIFWSLLNLNWIHFSDLTLSLTFTHWNKKLPRKFSSLSFLRIEFENQSRNRLSLLASVIAKDSFDSCKRQSLESLYHFLCCQFITV